MTPTRPIPAWRFGPYRIAESSPAPSSSWSATPWWGEPPAFDEIVIRMIENTAALEANLLSGAIDMIAGELGLTIDQALAFEKRHGDRYQVFYKPGLIYEHIDLNLDNPILADLRVRQALLHALDREALSEHLFGGRQPVARTPRQPARLGLHRDVPTYPSRTGRAAPCWRRPAGPRSGRHPPQRRRRALR